MTVALFCGSRKWIDPEPIRNVLEKLPEGSIIVHGDQLGADLIADAEAKKLGFDLCHICHTEFHAGILQNIDFKVLNQKFISLLNESKQQFFLF